MTGLNLQTTLSYLRVHPAAKIRDGTQRTEHDCQRLCSVSDRLCSLNSMLGHASSHSVFDTYSDPTVRKYLYGGTLTAIIAKQYE